MTLSSYSRLTASAYLETGVRLHYVDSGKGTNTLVSSAWVPANLLAVAACHRAAH